MRNRRFVKMMLGVSVGVLLAHGASGLSSVRSQSRPGEVVPVAGTTLGPIRVQANAIVIHGGRVYLAVDNRVTIATITGRRQFTEVGHTPALSDHVRDVAVVNGVAYVAAGTAGVRLFDVSTPAAPHEIGRVEGSELATALAVSGPYLYVARSHGGLQVVDISNPVRPEPVGSLATEQARDVFVVGAMAYVADGEGGLLLVDVREPAQPRQVGSFYTPGDANGVHVVGAYAYLAAGGAGLQVVNVSNPEAPVETGVFDAGYARGVYVVGGRAYVASERSGLWVVDVTNPGAPRALASLSSEGAVNAVHVVDGVAYTASASTSARAVTFDVALLERR